MQSNSSVEMRILSNSPIPPPVSSVKALGSMHLELLPVTDTPPSLIKTSSQTKSTTT